MYLSLENFPLLLAVGAGTGILGAILGTGGGVFLIPFLVLVFGVPMHYAVATSIVTVIATSTAVASANVERGTANMRLGMTLEIATSLGAIAGGLTVAILAPSLLEAIFACVMIPTAIMMWRGRTERAGDLATGTRNGAGNVGPTLHAESNSATGMLGDRYYDSALHQCVSYQVHQLWGGLGISFIAGILSGLLGIGGGVFKVPALHLVCGVPIKAAAATSNFMIGVTATASVFVLRPRRSSAGTDRRCGARRTDRLGGRLVRQSICRRPVRESLVRGAAAGRRGGNDDSSGHWLNLWLKLPKITSNSWPEPSTGRCSPAWSPARHS